MNESQLARKASPSDVSDEEWAFVAPYLTLMREDAPQREHPLREVFNGLRWINRAGAPWRLMPNDCPPWHTVYQQHGRWIEAEVFEAIVHDLRRLLREAQGLAPESRAAILDSPTGAPDPESGGRAGRGGWPPSPARPSWTAARCNRARRAAGGRATTGTSGATAARSTWRST